MKTRAIQKNKTQQKIMQEALRLIEAVGFSKFRTIDVAEAAGISHGALFVHYATRADLALRAAKQIGLDITNRIHEQAVSKTSLRSVLKEHLACLEHHENCYRSLLRERHLLSEDFSDCWAGLQSAVSEHIWRVARLEIKSGRIRRIQQHVLFNLWIGLVNHYVLNRELFVHGNSSVLKKHGADLVAQFIKLLRK